MRKYYLKTDFNPVKRRLLEKLGRFERAEEVALPLSFWRPVLQCVQHVVLEQLLVGDPNFDRLSWWAMFPVPGLYQRHIEGSACEP